MKPILESIEQLIQEQKIKKGSIKALFQLFRRGYKPHHITNRHIEAFRDRRYK